MCECVESVKAQVFEKIFLKQVANEVVLSPVCSFENEFIGGSFPLCQPVRVDYKLQTKLGKEIKRHKTYNMTLSYCPFCGEKSKVKPNG